MTRIAWETYDGDTGVSYVDASDEDAREIRLLYKGMYIRRYADGEIVVREEFRRCKKYGVRLK
jgi:hypothetical protein